MINDLDKTLAALLEKELPTEWVEQLTISFATPDGEFPSASVTLPAIDLFLYDVRENRELRNNEFGIERRDDGKVSKTPPPARIDCSYLITAWASGSSPNPAQDEHHLLSEVMRVLLRHRRLPEMILQGHLIGQEPPLRALPLQPNLLQSFGEFWQALGGKPKATLNYTVTLTVDLFAPVEAPLVKERVIRLSQGVDRRRS